MHVERCIRTTDLIRNVPGANPKLCIAIESACYSGARFATGARSLRQALKVDIRSAAASASDLDMEAFAIATTQLIASIFGQFDNIEGEEIGALLLTLVKRDDEETLYIQLLWIGCQ